MTYTEHMLKIARFMGLTPIRGVGEFSGNEYYYYNDEVLEDYRALPTYDTWEEIMPVVVKIESIANTVFSLVRNRASINGHISFGETKLDATIKAVNWWIDEYHQSSNS